MSNANAKPSDSDALLEASEQSFVENWGGLAKAFGMDPDLGRAHALIYIALTPLDDAAVAARLGLSLADASRQTNELVDWGVVTRHEAGGAVRYATDHDPWIWFLKIVAERHHREFVPVLTNIRKTLADMHALDASEPRARELRQRGQRFATFIEDLSRLIELFLRIGARPMATVLKTLAKIAPRW
jgi:DNA-binding transcriptional regulator GbsR (MarR family)